MYKRFFFEFRFLFQEKINQIYLRIQLLILQLLKAHVLFV